MNFSGVTTSVAPSTLTVSLSVVSASTLGSACSICSRILCCAAFFLLYAVHSYLAKPLSVCAFLWPVGQNGWCKRWASLFIIFSPPQKRALQMTDVAVGRQREPFFVVLFTARTQASHCLLLALGTSRIADQDVGSDCRCTGQHSMIYFNRLVPLTRARAKTIILSVTQISSCL